MEEIATPGTTTIATLAPFLGIGEERTAKAAFFVDRRRPVHRRHRPRRLRRQRDEARQRDQGDRRPATGARSRRSRPGAWSRATARRIGAQRLGRRRRRARRSARRTWSPGRTATGFHLRNVNVGRDYTPDSWPRSRTPARATPARPAGSPVQAPQGHRGRQHLQARDRLHDRRSARRTSARTAIAHPIVMGSYGIGLGRNVACIVEAHHDEKGIVWPAVGRAVSRPTSSRSAPNREPTGDRGRRAPPRGRFAAPPERAPELEILYDDRDESPGVKFTDAELLGMPLDPHREPAVAGGRRRRGDRAGDGRALDGPDRGGRGVRSSGAEAAGAR